MTRSSPWWWRSMGSGALMRSDSLKVGVFERGRVLEAIAEEPIDPDVREPDEAELDRAVCVRNDPDHCERDRPDRRVHGVVDHGAGLRAREVTEKREIGREEQQDERKPAVVLVEVDGE